MTKKPAGPRIKEHLTKLDCLKTAIHYQGAWREAPMSGEDKLEALEDIGLKGKISGHLHASGIDTAGHLQEMDTSVFRNHLSNGLDDRKFTPSEVIAYAFAMRKLLHLNGWLPEGTGPKMKGAEPEG